MTTLTSEERLSRTRAALMEAGYDRETVEQGTRVKDGRPEYNLLIIRPADAWRTLAVVAPSTLHRCWPCYSVGGLKDSGSPCGHDPITSEWPPLSPPMESREA